MIPALLQELARKSPSQENRAGFEDLLARTKPVLEYVERQPTIEAAAKEIDAWLESQQADPAKRARMEKLLQANPDVQAQTRARLEQLERDAHKLLERPDAAHLLLCSDEVQPWLSALSDAHASAG